MKNNFDFILKIRNHFSGVKDQKIDLLHVIVFACFDSVTEKHAAPSFAKKEKHASLFIIAPHFI